MNSLNLLSPVTAQRLKSLHLALLLAGSASWTQGFAADAASAPPSNTVADSSQLETVTVTTRRREESAQDVPTPMSVVSGQAIETQRVYRIQDLQQLVPSVNVAYKHARQTSVSIRGLGTNPASDGLEGSAGLYIDNVYLGRPGMAVFDLMDIDQLEVLRGPQGTLFGKNTTAGVININTRAPTFTPERSIETSIGEDGYIQTKGTVSGPLNDQLAGRFSAYRTHSDGDIKNEYNDHELGGGTREGFRAQLLFKPNESFNLRWIGDYNEEDSSAGTPVLYSTGPTINGTNLYRTLANTVGATLVNGSHRKVNLDDGQHVTVHQGGTSVEANWTLPSDFTLTSISSYRWWDFTPRNDDGLNVATAYNSGVSVKDKQYSQELRLASPKDEFFDYVVGAYYFGSDLDNKSFISFGPQADVWNGTPAGALNNVSSVGKGHIETNSFALFAQGTWHLSQRLDFTAGVRGTYEEKSAYFNQAAPVGGAAVAGTAANVRNNILGAYDSGDLNLYSFSPTGLLNLSYHFTDGLLGYATLSHGEKSGGVNLDVGSAPTAGADSLLIGAERANNAELGFKSTLWDRRLQLNANVFWTQVNGYQTNAYDDVHRVNYLTNAGAVRSRGVEFESTLIPMLGLTLNVNGSYNDVSYLSYKNAPCPPEVRLAPGAPASCDLTGRQVVGASKWIGNVNGEYKWNLNNGFEEYMTASYAFRSKAVGTVEDSVYGQIPSYALINLSTGLRGDFDRGQWDISLWLKNAFDKTYYTALGTGANGSYDGLLGTPRTLGVTGRYDF